MDAWHLNSVSREGVQALRSGPSRQPSPVADRPGTEQGCSQSHPGAAGRHRLGPITAHAHRQLGEAGFRRKSRAEPALDDWAGNSRGIAESVRYIGAEHVVMGGTAGDDIFMQLLFDHPPAHAWDELIEACRDQLGVCFGPQVARQVVDA